MNFSLAIVAILLGVSIFVATVVYVYRTIAEVRRLSKEHKEEMKYVVDVCISNSERIAKLERNDKSSQS